MSVEQHLTNTVCCGIEIVLLASFHVALNFFAPKVNGFLSENKCSNSQFHATRGPDFHALLKRNDGIFDGN